MSPKTRRVLALTAGILALASAVYFAWPFLSDPERVERLVTESGAWGPLVFIGLQILQVLIAPIPGQIAGLAGGYLFGTGLGVLYSTIGSLIGFTIAFLLARRLGRAFVERHVSPKKVRRFDFVTNRSGGVVLFMIFLLPAFPDDVVAFLAGLISMRIPTFMLVSLAGRLPGTVLLSLAGAELAGA